jgi:S-adenosylmethionine:tRNA-ribosyltransferase-isomerase (queuine synthetase)
MTDRLAEGEWFYNFRALMYGSIESYGEMPLPPYIKRDVV